MSEEMVDIDGATVSLAYGNFVEMFFPGNDANRPGGGKGMHFWAFLGMKTTPATANQWRMPKEAARRCRLLAGPHYEMVAKAMLARGHQYKNPIEF